MLQKVFWQVCLDRMLCKDHHCLNFGLYTLVISVFVAVLTYASTGESAGRREMTGLFFAVVTGKMANFEAANRPCRGGGPDSIMDPIFIIGMPESGKTTFGRSLARRLVREFIDLDFCITQRFRASVAEIFARDGEEAFRRREAAMLREVGEMEDVVVACGGGTPCFSSNMEYMNGRGLTVCLTATPERLRERMLLGGDKRPLVKGKSEAELGEYVAAVLAERGPYYSRAKVFMESSQLEDRRQISAAVDRFLADNPGLF